MQKKHIHNIYLFILLLVISIITSSCQRASIHQDSVGKPYEVLIIGEHSQVLDSVLSVPSPGLPQNEPSLDIIKAKELTEDNNNYRTIIILNTKSKEAGGSVMIKKDKYAKEQTVIYLSAHSPQDLNSFLRIMGTGIRTEIIKGEIAQEQRHLIKEHNPAAETLIQKIFGRRMLIPKELIAHKKGNKFLWFSNNTSEGMINICLYKADINHFRSERDKIMQACIPGEKKGQYMITDSIISTQTNKSSSMIIRGLWKMKGDAMGGPFIAYVPSNQPNNREKFVAEAFIFAPEGKKRNLMRKAETALYTLNIKYHN